MLMVMTTAEFAGQLEKLRRQLQGYLASRGLQASDIDDLLQDTLARALEKLPQLRDKRKLGGWCRRIAQDRLRAFYNDRQPRHWGEFYETVKEAGPDLREQFLAQLDALFARIGSDVNPREALTGALFYCLNWPARDIAVQLEVRLVTVYQRLARLRRRLRSASPSGKLSAGEAFVDLKCRLAYLLFWSGYSMLRGRWARNEELMRDGYALLRLVHLQHPSHLRTLTLLMHAAFVLASLKQYDPDYPNFLQWKDWKREVWDPALCQAARGYYRRFLELPAPDEMRLKTEFDYLLYNAPSHAEVQWGRMLEIGREIQRRWPNEGMHRSIAMCLFHLENPRAAAQYLEANLRHPRLRQDRTILGDIADFYFLSDSWKKARQYYRQYLRDYPVSESVKGIMLDRIRHCGEAMRNVKNRHK